MSPAEIKVIDAIESPKNKHDLRIILGVGKV